MDYMTLMGSEDVRAAGNAMRQAGHDMQGAASQIEDSLRRHRDFLDDWLSRFEAALSADLTTKEQPRDE